MYGTSSRWSSMTGRWEAAPIRQSAATTNLNEEWRYRRNDRRLLGAARRVVGVRGVDESAIRTPGFAGDHIPT
jgi:hypothetical protein